jgi:hypothetical protein
MSRRDSSFMENREDVREGLAGPPARQLQDSPIEGPETRSNHEHVVHALN